MSIFTRNAVTRPKSSWFPFRPSNTLTVSMPYLTPVLCTDILPGDKWRMQSEVFARMMPLLAPVMAEVDVYVHYFFCPLRIITQDFDKFFNPEEQDNIVRPFIDPAKFVSLFGSAFPAAGQDIPVDKSQRTAQEQAAFDFLSLFAESSLADYLGIPVFSWSDFAYNNGTDASPAYYYDLQALTAYIANIRKFSAYPFLMYQLIYDEFYRDQTLEDSILEQLDRECDGMLKGKINLDEAFDVFSVNGWELLMSKRSRAWQKDYFTSALPTPQSGPDVHLPLTGDAPVVWDNDDGAAQIVRTREGAVAAGRKFVDGNESIDEDFLSVDPDGNLNVNTFNPDSSITFSQGDRASLGGIDPNGTLKADMSEVTSATINELRRAVRAQEFLEKCARGGRRYIEMILSHFGVKSSDGRLDRPEFLGGGRQPFTITEVLSHVGEDDTQNFVLGEMGGHGVSYGNTSKTKRFFEEHGFLFAILSIIPKASYQQGLARMWTRESLFDYAWPSFANLGEQEIHNYELYAQSADPEGTFGYAPRYSEYKYLPSTVHGAMRSSLSYWHLGRIFATAPALNGDFVHPRPDELNRIFAVQDETDDKIVVVIKHHIKAKRRLPKYGIPTL